MIPYTYNFDYYVGDTYPIVIIDGSIDSSPLFAALPYGGTNWQNSYISTDSLTWTAVTLPVESRWSDVAYGNGRLVSVSYGATTNHIVASGINENNDIYWTQYTMPSYTNWSTVSFGNSIFVSIGRGRYAAVSTNGIYWTSSTMPLGGASSDQWQVTYGNEKFVAVTSGYNITAYSTNGISWTVGTMPSYGWKDIEYGNEKYVAIRSSNVSAYSTNGISWTQVTLPSSNSLTGIFYGNNKWVVTGTPTQIVMSSTDGISWIMGTMPVSAGWWDCTYGNDVFVSLGGSSIQAQSTDAITWTLSSSPPSNSTGYRTIIHADISYPNNIKYSQNKTGLFTVSTERGNPDAEVFSVELEMSYPEYRLTTEITPELGSLLTGASYVYDIEVSDDDETYTLLTGTIRTQQDVISN